MLQDIFRQLDELVSRENLTRTKSNSPLPQIKNCSFQVLGQLALVELNISTVATRDCDTKTDADHWIKEEFNRILKMNGLVWDPHSHEIKMPKETEYDDLYIGKNINAQIAQPEYILISKARYDPFKNRGVFEEYIAAGPSKKFLKLCEKYKIDLNKLLEQ